MHWRGPFRGPGRGPGGSSRIVLPAPQVVIQADKVRGSWLRGQAR
jgi:hypothetical protein